MREYYLSRSKFGSEYFLDEHEFANKRISIGLELRCETLNQLKNILDFKRKTIIYLVEPFDKTLEDCLKVFFENSKIEIERVKLG